MNTPQDTDLKSSLLRRFLSVYWLRPENAFWMTLRSLTLARCRFVSPVMDNSCGDGLFSFLHAGGRLDPSFDVFASLSQLDRAATGHADMFSVSSEGYQPKIIRKPQRSIDVGTDLKTTLIEKANALDFYDRLVHHDNNQPLPFDDDPFSTV